MCIYVHARVCVFVSPHIARENDLCFLNLKSSAHYIALYTFISSLKLNKYALN